MPGTFWTAAAKDRVFRLIWTGEVLLGLAIIGAAFLENMFAQHLAHKTVLSIVAWLVFAVLLWGLHKLGWRGTTAAKWTLAGFCLLIIAYFGSKLVLELILQCGPPDCGPPVAMTGGFIHHTVPV